ncbi:glycosyltransferase family 2 protein [Desulfonema ishimotonii]|uniref:Glycosyltransferase family 2 protein n=1 Tax=Desulfonema ishimotonii TaxID=45657 RepID=A0A401FUM1_9BACT|nr:glycosyltransferase family A protein [Desulfonema ishimotonii]GBC60666.1 glycosyltransferase family 2 protein [Desulfonema ishimotonii]
MTSDHCDISVVIPVHAEGRLVQHTLNSAKKAMAYAKAHGDVRTDIVIVLDRPDKKTENFFASYDDLKVHFEKTDFGDAGLARNFGVGHSSGRYIAFLDADNLFGQSWLYKAFCFLEKNPTTIIAHPEYNVVFEGQNLIWKQISCDHPQFRSADLIEHNYWDTTCLASKKIFLDFPYEATMATQGFGHEDWHFNCETLAAGIGHYIVPDTVLFLRRKLNGSVLERANRGHRIIAPSRLFDPSFFSKLVRSEK